MDSVLFILRINNTEFTYFIRFLKEYKELHKGKQGLNINACTLNIYFMLMVLFANIVKLATYLII